ncbi:MAG: DNA photolyase [candidate division KSB1 bacterium]|nr:DNA photolyase [candidate division KSB1 bacterium]
MPYEPYWPEQVFVEQRVLAHPVSQQILDRLSPLQPMVIDNLRELSVHPPHLISHTSSRSRPLVLAFQKSKFLKKCPGTKKYICCGYQILNLVNNCELGCSYCILQGYLNSPFITIYVNIDDLFSELQDTLAAQPPKIYRIGTGELADSLSTDHLTNYSSQLVQFFKNKQNAIIELKTKTTQIDNFLHLDHGGRTIVAWSLNTPQMIASEEPWAPTLDERLAAAVRCQAAGFKLAFHFDPMIWYPNWEEEYRKVVDKIFEHIAPDHIIWISLGALRYPHQLEAIIRGQHPETKIVYGELVPGLDGKLRYFKALRIEMFGKMYRWIKQHAPQVFVYLCMESHEVWQRAFGWSPRTSAGLKRIMDQLLQK